MTDGPWIVIPNWEKFQHGTRRDDPWIKNYKELLHRDDYLSLVPVARGLLHGLWLLYAQHAGQVRAASVHGALQMRAKRGHWDALVQAGFIELSASKPARTPGRAGTRAGEELEVENYPLTPAERENGINSKRPTPRGAGTNPRALGTNPRAQGINPRALGTNPRGDNRPLDIYRSCLNWVNSPAYDPATMDANTVVEEFDRRERKLRATLTDEQRAELAERAEAIRGAGP